LLSESLTIEQVKMLVDNVRRSRFEPTTWTTEVSVNLQPVEPSTYLSSAPPAISPQVRDERDEAHAMHFDRGYDAPAVRPAPVLQIAPQIVPQKSAEPSPIDILRMEADWAKDRVRMLEEMIYDLFNEFGSKIPGPIADKAARMGVFEYRYREMQNAG
jgi:hypothetical protein